MQIVPRSRYFYVLVLVLGLGAGVSVSAEGTSNGIDQESFAWNRASLTEHREHVKALVDDLLGPAAPPKTEAPVDNNPANAKPKP